MLTLPASILVVDDNDPIRAVIVRILEREGHRVEEARDGEEALRVVDAGAFDLVVLDVVLPGMSGVATAKAIRVGHPSTPIVYVSGCAPSEIPQGTTAFVAKPFTKQALIDAVEKELETRVAK